MQSFHNAHGMCVPQTWKLPYPCALFSCCIWMFVANTNWNHIEFRVKLFLEVQDQRPKGKKFLPSSISPLAIAFLGCSPSSHEQELCQSPREDKRTCSLLLHVHGRIRQPPLSAFHCHQTLQHRGRRGKGAWGAGGASMGQMAAAVMLHPASTRTAVPCLLVSAD